MYQVVPAHNYFFWVRCHPSKIFSPQRSLSGNPKIDPFFLPTTRSHPLNTLTRGLPPMYWLGTSRWCLGPLCMLHFVWIFFFLAFTPFLLSSCFFILLYVLVGVYLLWREGCVGFWTYVPCLSSLPQTGCCLDEGPHLPTEPIFFSFLCLWASLLWILPHLFIMPAIALSLFFISCFPWAYRLMLLPCQPTFHIFTSFGPYWPTFLLC